MKRWCAQWVTGCMLLSGLAPTSPAQSSEVPAGGVAAPTDFAEVTAKLETGGSLYVYLSTEQFLGGLAGKIENLAAFLSDVAQVNEDERRQMEQVFAAVANQVRRSGVESIAGVGMSVIEAEPGLHRARWVMHRRGSPEGYLWRFFGSAPHPLHSAQWLPADTAWTTFGDLDLEAIWQTLKSAAEQAELTPLVEQLQAVSQQVLQVTGRSLEDQLASLGGDLGVVLTLDPAKPFTLSMEGASVSDLPEPGLLLAISVEDDGLYDWAVAQLAQNPQASQGEAAGARWHSLPSIGRAPFPVQPTVARVGNYLLLATQTALVERVARVLQGAEPGLDETEEWKRLTRSLPSEGNSYCFVSSRFGEALTRVQQSLLEQQMAQEGAPNVDLAKVQEFFGLSMTAAVFSVSWCDDFGWQWVGQSTQDPVGSIARAALLMPAGLLAGVAVPAIVTARERAQSAVCMNHARQVWMAMEMYTLEHDNVLPSEPATDLKDLLGNVPAAFVCPSLKPPDDLAWEDAQASGGFYEYLVPGQNMGELDGEAPVLRCPVHGTEVFADGRVTLPEP